MSTNALTPFLDERAARYGDMPALIYRGRALSYRFLADQSRRVAGGLADLGVTGGDRVALWLPNVPAWVVLFFACAQLGAIAVAVNTRFRSAEVADIVGRSGARVLAMWPSFKGIDFVGILSAIDRSELSALETLVIYDEGEAAPTATDWPRASYDDLPRRPARADACGDSGAGTLIFTTSGTTSAPKFVLHSHHSLVAHARNVAPAFEYDADDTVLLQALPLCGTFGHAQLMAALVAGRPSVLMPFFDGDAAVAAIRDYGVTHFNGSDEMFRRLLDAVGSGKDLGNLRSCGFAAFDPALGNIVAEAARYDLRLHGLYGMSEVQALFARQNPDAAVAVRRLSGGALTSADARVRAVDAETGDVFGHGKNGELEVKGPSLMLGYHGNAEATAAAMTDDGYLRTGDLGYTTEDGGFVFLIRMGDVLRLAGNLVSPAEIEARLAAHPSVTECQAVGVDTPTGPRAAAFVIPTVDGQFDEGALRTFCAEGLAGYKVPVAIYDIERFPVTPSPNGVKIQRAKLRTMAQRRLAET